ncbi:hypothetical protein JCM17960_15940 [Magnetospira thiophila]
MRKWLGFIGGFFAVTLVTGCVKYHVGGEFVGSGQTFFGSVIVSFDRGSIDVASADGSVTCEGSSKVISRPSLFVDTGGAGEASATCSDGRTIKVDFIQTSETGGHGQGIDSDGKEIWLVYSTSEKTIASKVRQRQLDNLVK